MANFAQNVARQRYSSNAQRLRDHLAFRRGAAFTTLLFVLGEKGANDIAYALSKGNEQQRTQWLEWYVDKIRIAGW